MPELIDPTARLRTSFLAAVAEFRQDSDYPAAWFVADVDPPALTDAAALPIRAEAGSSALPVTRLYRVPTVEVSAG
ncbi:hypothetical protein [Streptomyces monashensis]|uniref:Uncharacterized protein n=1 Tax=Streptomyces monashensis TaxID=1678012 RepID=A0A1S2QIE6_9ACTN|nr:hypothetical protein [Streptomyces monashensis]OIK05216.1 hypothetical protein BIV23_13205 [Streptomyces monashensis]